jgi:FlaA1/EpsC-like NDP-sugar epimerase
MVIFEIPLFLIFLVGIFNRSLYPAMTSLVCMGVIALPWIVYKKEWLHLPWAVTAAAGSILLLHSLGIILRFYDKMWWWDTMTHMMATLIIALLTALACMSADRGINNLRIPLRYVPAFTLMSVVLLGAIWEVLEFVSDGALGLNMQYSLDDTVTDLTFDILGGALVVLAMIPILDQVKQASQAMFILPRDADKIEEGNSRSER